MDSSVTSPALTSVRWRIGDDRAPADRLRRRVVDSHWHGCVDVAQFYRSESVHALGAARWRLLAELRVSVTDLPSH